MGEIFISTLTLFFPTYPFDPPENVKKSLVKQEKNLWFCEDFRGIQMENWEEKD